MTNISCVSLLGRECMQCALQSRQRCPLCRGAVAVKDLVEGVLELDTSHDSQEDAPVVPDLQACESKLKVLLREVR